MRNAALFLADGFEEIEAVGTVDALRRANIKTILVSITEERKVTGTHCISVMADALFANVDYSDVYALILPGGMPGTFNLNEYDPLKDLLVRHNEAGKLIAAIGSAPWVLGELELLKGREVTCYRGYEHHLAGATVTEETCVKDGNIITGKGPGFVFDFAQKIIIHMQSRYMADMVAIGLQLPIW
ncbi:MAG: DJ-1/PfpI family protein [Tannerellaceae bacterium]|nr:DJ-1/PfpI family protein [Tannerellaceae bacterium]